MPFGRLRQFCVDSVLICKTSLMALATVEMAVSREREITTHVIGTARARARTHAHTHTQSVSQTNFRNFRT
jgi:hypothetical protein